MSGRLDDVLRAHDVFVASDNRFQQRARLLQALWREETSLPVGLHRGLPLGSRLAMPRAQQSLENYLTHEIRACVRREVLADPREGKLYGAPRIFDDLLSSQPMCFNLFAELQADLELATRGLRAVAPRQIDAVTAIRFEHSPGRGDARYTGDRSAFDVFVEYRGSAGRRGFIAIEVKYHEALGDPAARLRPRYEEIADAMGIFRNERRALLRAKPLQQIWRDHLLMGSLLLAREFDEGTFAFLYPRDNFRCSAALDDYAACLLDPSTFCRWTLEDLVAATRAAGAGPWIDAFHRRYLDFSRVDALAPACSPESMS